MVELLLFIIVPLLKQLIQKFRLTSFRMELALVSPYTDTERSVENVGQKITDSTH